MDSWECVSAFLFLYLPVCVSQSFYVVCVCVSLSLSLASLPLTLALFPLTASPLSVSVSVSLSVEVFICLLFQFWSILCYHTQDKTVFVNIIVISLLNMTLTLVCVCVCVSIMNIVAKSHSVQKINKFKVVNQYYYNNTNRWHICFAYSPTPFSNGSWSESVCRKMTNRVYITIAGDKWMLEISNYIKIVNLSEHLRK